MMLRQIAITTAFLLAAVARADAMSFAWHDQLTVHASEPTDRTCAGTTMPLANARVHRTLLTRSTGKSTKGWATINALQFLESETRINILTIRVRGGQKCRHEADGAIWR
jgi:hypothetical protein